MFAAYHGFGHQLGDPVRRIVSLFQIFRVRKKNAFNAETVSPIPQEQPPKCRPKQKLFDFFELDVTLIGRNLRPRPMPSYDDSESSDRFSQA